MFIHPRLLSRNLIGKKNDGPSLPDVIGQKASTLMNGPNSSYMFIHPQLLHDMWEVGTVKEGYIKTLLAQQEDSVPCGFLFPRERGLLHCYPSPLEIEILSVN